MQETARRYIDVRERSEYAAAHIEGAELVPLGTLWKRCAAWDRGEPLTIVCRSGQRASVARTMLAAMHLKDVEVLRGGMVRWHSEGNPVMTLDGVQASDPRAGWIGEGIAILISLALALSLSTWFLAIAALLGIKWYVQRNRGSA